MHEIQVIERCDFDAVPLTDDDHRDVPVSVDGKGYLVDACDACYRSRLEPVLEAIVKSSRPGDPPPKKRPRRKPLEGAEALNGQTKSHKAKTGGDLQCPDCPRKFVNNVGLGIHRAKHHGYVSPQKAQRLAREKA